MKRNKSLNRKKAISLIVLVITIIIIVIIATTGVVLVAKSGIFHSSTELTFKNDMSQYSDRIKNYFGSKVSDENENIRISGENLVEYIPELKDSKYLDKLYVLDGELVIDGSKITEDEKNWAKEIGIHVSDSLEIIGLDVVTTENTIEIKSINTSGNIPKGVKYKFKLDDNEKESTTSSYTFGKLESGKYYLVNVSIVSSEGQELASYKKNIKTRINNDVVDIKLSTENWTKGPIKVILEYENIPQAYKIQYKIGKEEFKDYTKEFEVTENNTFIYARLYNKDVGRDTSNNYVEIKNIDKEVPLKPTAISATSGINSIKVRASGSQDSLSGILGYKYSLDGITYTSAIKAYEDYTFTNINADTIKTIYTKAVDNVGNESEVYSKDWSTWEASEKVKISIDPLEDLWTNKAVTVSLSHQSIPTNYIMQYRINNGSWTDGYTAKVTENRTKIEARLYNKNLNDEIGLNSLTIGNIDRIAPNVISAEFNPTKNTIEVSNIVAKDEGGSGIANYELSIKKHSDIYYTPYTSEQNKYTFEGLVKDTLYDIHIRVYDKAGNASDYYSKSVPTVCTITLDSQGADSGKEGTKTIYEKYEKGFYDTEDCINKITSISIPQKTGFVFDGYYTEKNGQGTKMIDDAGNITTNLKNSYYTSAGTLYANWVAKKITVIFMRNTTANDTTSDTQEFTYGVTGQSFSAKGWTKKGYTLLGWHEDKNSTAKRYNIISGVQDTWIESKYNASSNHTVALYAIWQPNTYTVKYNGNGATGGTTANSSHTYDVDKKLTKNGYTRAYTVTYNHNYTGSTNTTKTATYSFVNWNTAANGTGTKYANEATVKNLTDKNNDTFNLYAIWKSASLTYVPTRTGYVFDGWFEDDKCTKRATSNNGVYAPTVNKTLYAHWVEKQIKVIFVRNMPETNPVGATFDSNYKDDYSSDATNQTFTYSVSGQKFSAKGWSHPQYDIIAWNENRTATSGYQVLSGVTNAWIESKYNASTNHTVTLYAIWQPKVFTISLNNMSADKTAGTTAVYEKFNKGKYLDSACTKDLTLNKITIPEKTGHTFKGYYTEQNGKGTKIIDENGNVTSAFTNRYFKSNSALYANWGANTYTVKYNGNGATGGTTANNSHTYDVDKKLTKNGYTRAYTVTYNHNYTGSTNTTKTATYSFVNWNTIANGTGTKYENEATVKNLTAVNNGVVNLYAIWNSASVTYVPTRTGYAFAGWFEDAGCTKEITDNKGVYTPTANKTLYAKWIANTYTVKYNGNGATGGTTADSLHAYDVDKKLTKNGYTRAYTVTYNHNYTGSTDISKTATYSFVNWNTKADGTGTKYANEATVKNLTDKNNDTFNLYAIWKSASITYVPTRNDSNGNAYVFTGWYKEATCKNRVTDEKGVYTPNGTITTLYAGWKQVYYQNTSSGKYYVTLNEAFSEVQNTTPPNTIIVLSNVTETNSATLVSGKLVNLNTNGKNITFNGAYGITNNGTLSIQGSGTISGSNAHVVHNVGVLNIAVCTITNKTNGTTRAIWNDYTGTVNMSSGTVSNTVTSTNMESNTTTPYAVANGGIFNLKGGTIASTSSGNDLQYGVYTTGQFNMSGGAIVTCGTAIYMANKKDTTTNGGTNITGGTIRNTSTGRVAVQNVSNGTLTISGNNTISITSTASKGIYLTGPGKVNITAPNLTVSGNTNAISNKDTGTITISGAATFTATKYACVENEGTGSISIGAGTFNGKTYGINNKSTGTITVTGGTIDASGGTGISVGGGTLTLGKDDGSVSTTNPSITGSSIGMEGGNIKAFNFYDGVIISNGSNGTALHITATKTPTNYTVQQDDNGKKAYLRKNRSTLTIDPNGGSVKVWNPSDATSYTTVTSSKSYTRNYDSKIKLSVPTKKNASDTENYTVTYDYAGATGGNSTKTSSSAKTTVTKYTFNSWSGQGATAAPITKDTENGTTYYYYTFPKTEAATSNYIATYSQTQTSTYSSVTLPKPTKTGYTFAGWYTESGTKAGAGGASYTPKRSLTLHASWTANEYKVTLDSNGGEDYLYEGTTFDVTYDGKYGNLSYFISSHPTKTGYVFTGWYTAASGGTNITASSTVSTAKNHTLYAHWTEKHILITYYSNGATKVGSEETAGLSSDKTKSTITTTVRWTNRTGVNLWNCTSLFSRPGYHTPSNATAWRLGASNSTVYINQASQNFTDYFDDGVETKIKLYANWEKHKYGAYETSTTKHWKTCSVCKAVVSGNHTLSGNACGSTDLIIPKNSYSGTKDSFGRFIYDAKCKKCGGNVDYHSSYDFGKPSTDISKKFSTYKGTDGKTYGYANCPKKKCSTCGGWFDP